jgi:hypothetical protein
MSGKFALVIGNSHYDDSKLGRLKTPDVDIAALESVLKDSAIGQFDDVGVLLNESCAAVRRAVARFYDQRRREDLLFLYFSGHGVKDEQGHLYLAVRDTEIALLAGTAIEAAFISARMDRSISKRQVLVLDCCHSGAFAHGSKSAQGTSVGVAEAFEGTGVGRVILTATDATQYAWEGEQITGDAHNSLFTHFLIKGLKTGAADQDGDGLVTVDELYDYLHEQVVTTTPRQTPYKWTYQQRGEIVVAHNPFVKRSMLPAELSDAIASRFSNVRLDAIRDLDGLLRANDIGLSRAALAALKDLSQDDSRKVANAATNALKADEEERRGRRAKPWPPNEVLNDSWRDGPALADDESAESHPADVFISYAREDRVKAKALAQVISEQGWRIWWDRRIAPGESFDIVIERQLRTCKCAIVLWSAQSVDATWVRNEARRAARRQVLVPILIEAVETPLEFENLQAADLTSWEPPAEHPELKNVFDKIRQLAPIPHDRLARAAVERAHREFAAGRHQAAITSLAQFRPEHAVVAAALGELRGETARLERERLKTARREQEAADRQRALNATSTRIQELLGGDQLEAAGRALDAGEKEFGATVLFALRQRWATLHAQAEQDQQAQTAVAAARREFAAGQPRAAITRLEQFRPEHAVVTAALVELRGEAARLERDHLEKARREQEAADRQRALDAARTRIKELLGGGDLVAAARALDVAEEEFEATALSPLRQQWTALHTQAVEDQRAQTAVVAARREFAAARHQAAVEILEAFHPEHPIVVAALAELRTDAARLERERLEKARREQEVADRQRALDAARTRIEELLGGGDLEAAARALDAGEKQSGATAFSALRQQWTTLHAQAERDQRAQTAVAAARREFAAGRHQAAITRLAQFRPDHPVVTAALGELRQQAAQLERERLEKARREQEAADRRRALNAARTRIEELLGGGDLEAAVRALDAGEKEFGIAALTGLRHQWTARHAEEQENQRAQTAVDAALREFAAGQHQAAVARLEAFGPENPVVAAALAALHGEAKRVERARLEVASREKKDTAPEPDAAEKESGTTAGTAHQRRQTVRHPEAVKDALAQAAVAAALREFAAGQHQAAVASLEAFRPEHAFVAAALTELRGKVKQIEHERAEIARNETGPPLEKLREREGKTTAGAHAGAARAPAAEPRSEARAEREANHTWQWSRVIYFSGAAAVLALMVGMWWATSPNGGATVPPAQPGLSAPQPPGPTPVDPQLGNAQEGMATAKPPAVSGGSREATEGVNRGRATQPGDRTAESAPSRDLERLRRAASQRLTAGELEESLGAAVAGLKIDPKDAVLNGIIAEILRVAQADSDRTKQEAVNARRDLPPNDLFIQGLQNEAAASKARAGRQNDDAIRSYRSASEDFRRATEQYKKAAADAERAIQIEQAEQAIRRKLADAEQAKALAEAETAKKAEEAKRNAPPVAVARPAPTPAPPVLPPPSPEEQIRQVLKQYATAYEQMNVDAILELHPTLSRSQLEGAFAQYRAYAMNIGNVMVLTSGNMATVTCTIVTNIRPRVGDAQSFRRATTLRLEKRGESWIIFDRR